MIIIGCDLQPYYKQIAMMDTQTRELAERTFEQQNREAQALYAGLPRATRVGMEATGYEQRFDRMLAKWRHELWIGHASEMCAGMVRKQKTDARDATHLLRLLVEKRFPRTSPAKRDTLQLLRHIYKLACLVVSVKNQLHRLAMNQGICEKEKLFTTAGARGVGKTLTLSVGGRG